MGLPEIPQSALDRKQLLNGILMSIRYAPKWSPLLNDIKELLDSTLSTPGEVALGQIEIEGLLEECSDVIRNNPNGPNYNRLKRSLEPLLIYHRRKRSLNPEDEPTYRFGLTYEKEASIEMLGTSEIQRIFLSALQAEGILLKYDFSKTPKPLIELWPILPPYAISSNEYLEFRCRRDISSSENELTRQLNLRLPSGLTIKNIIRTPTYASAIHELVIRSDWAWPINQHLLSGELLEKRISDFNSKSSDIFPNSSLKRTSHELKVIIHNLRLENQVLSWSTWLNRDQSPNPIKAIAHILQIDSDKIFGIKRISLTLKEDIRVKQSNKFTRKLRNIHEDATILDDDSSITIENEDDDYIALG